MVEEMVGMGLIIQQGSGWGLGGWGQYLYALGFRHRNGVEWNYQKG